MNKNLSDEQLKNVSGGRGHKAYADNSPEGIALLLEKIKKDDYLYNYLTNKLNEANEDIKKNNNVISDRVQSDLDTICKIIKTSMNYPHC